MDRIILGDQLRAMRLSRGFDLDFAAQNIGITTNTLERLEQGLVTAFQVDLLLQIVTVYGYNIVFKPK